MIGFFTTINNAIEKGQSCIESHIPEIPKDAVKGVGRSFACSFAASILFSRRNPSMGLAGGALAALATAIHIAFITGAENLQTRLCHRSNTPKEPISFQGRHCAFLLGWGGILYLSDVLGLVNKKASFLLTIPFFLWNNTFGESIKTPIMGIVVFR